MKFCVLDRALVDPHKSCGFIFFYLQHHISIQSRCQVIPAIEQCPIFACRAKKSGDESPPVFEPSVVRSCGPNHFDCTYARRRHGGTTMPAVFIDFLMAAHMVLTTCLSSSGLPTKIRGNIASKAA
ncbi:phytochrome interacting factor 3-like 6 [Striga asiatica]|uniref:Phytochrome interacting factor 3-like 6 n=1 Tax=Striga asiatica TaxID=4170 RepID=A0A5A7RGF9_STRAF|nr:phytochrome interacting factor 3-like 6 [Striga asiatica]